MPPNGLLILANACMLAFHMNAVELREAQRWYGFWDYGDVMHSYDPDRRPVAGASGCSQSLPQKGHTLDREGGFPEYRNGTGWEFDAAGALFRNLVTIEHAMHHPCSVFE